VEAVMTFHNPNNFALDLDKAAINAVYEEKILAKIDQNYETSFPAKSEFKMPLHIDLDVTKIYDYNSLKAVSQGLKLLLT
jgi:hypothetical protein